jgi:hypothetical protein
LKREEEKQQQKAAAAAAGNAAETNPVIACILNAIAVLEAVLKS